MMSNCPSCDNQIAEEAYSCIHCGFPLKDYRYKVYYDNLPIHIFESEIADALLIFKYNAEDAETILLDQPFRFSLEEISMLKRFFEQIDYKAIEFAENIYKNVYKNSMGIMMTFSDFRGLKLFDKLDYVSKAHPSIDQLWLVLKILILSKNSEEAVTLLKERLTKRTDNQT